MSNVAVSQEKRRYSCSKGHEWESYGPDRFGSLTFSGTETPIDGSRFCLRCLFQFLSWRLGVVKDEPVEGGGI